MMGRGANGKKSKTTGKRKYKPIKDTARTVGSPLSYFTTYKFRIYITFVFLDPLQ